MSILQYKDLILRVNGSEQGLVQSATVSCDAGLDLISVSTGTIPYIKDRAGEVVYEQLLTSAPNFKDIAGFISPITITLSETGTNAPAIKANECLLTNAEYRLSVKDLFVGTYTYSTIGLELEEVSTTGNFAKDGRAPYRPWGFASFGPNQQAVSASVSLKRTNIYEKGDGRPKYSVVSFPVETNVSINMGSQSGIYNELEATISGFNKITTCAGAQPAEQSISITVSGAGLSIGGCNLQKIETSEGTTAGGPQTITANYVSYEDYGLLSANRKVNYSTASATPAPPEPPPEPE